MLAYFSQYELLVDAGLIAVMLALSQYVVLKAGVFSVATVGLSAISAYVTALCQIRGKLDATSSIVVGTACAIIVGALIALPLSRLRGIFQAIATLSFVIVIQSCILLFENYTGGASGLNSIPKTQSTLSLAIVDVIAIAFLWILCRGTTGKAFDAIRQDEIAAACHGVSVRRYQTYAFLLSALLAGVAGALIANYSYSLVPEQFDFSAVVSILTYVVIGGVGRISGALLGTVFLIALPEIVRPLANERLVLNGVLLILISIYLPNGVIDSLAYRMRARRLRHMVARLESTISTPASSSAIRVGTR